jgi:hypothetical protein
VHHLFIEEKLKERKRNKLMTKQQLLNEGKRLGPEYIDHFMINGHFPEVQISSASSEIPLPEDLLLDYLAKICALFSL